MSFKKSLKRKNAQAMLDYLCTSMMIIAAVLAIALVPRVRNVFSATAANVMAGAFGAQVE